MRRVRRPDVEDAPAQVPPERRPGVHPRKAGAKGSRPRATETLTGGGGADGASGNRSEELRRQRARVRARDVVSSASAVGVLSKPFRASSSRRFAQGACAVSTQAPRSCGSVARGRSRCSCPIRLLHARLAPESVKNGPRRNPNWVATKAWRATKRRTESFAPGVSCARGHASANGGGRSNAKSAAIVQFSAAFRPRDWRRAGYAGPSPAWACPPS